MRRSKPADPTAERTSEESTQSSSGLTGGKPPQPKNKGDEDLIARRRAAENAVPRRYELDEDPVMPEDDATLKTKI